ncbi:hypothetical protein KSP39_PZI018059 [Platanthera zijinensis]|uniref:RING-type domain-containing protein n=1 Tax=Platanthera zijinensis TaxID=2320716 RepID=A0AAP0FZ03_9ASPA
MESSSGRSDPEEVCPICLEPPKREAYLDHCFHSFCYHCIVQWSKFVKKKSYQEEPSIKCPLCKAENLSIVHSFDGESFLRFYFNGDSRNSFFTSSHGYRLQCYSCELDDIHETPLWSQTRESSYYSFKNVRLISHLYRGIMLFIQEEDVGIIVHHVHGVIEAFFRSNKGDNTTLNPEKRREMFRALLIDAAWPFLHARTERFADELELFLASGLNIDAYDEVYMHHLENYSSSEASGHVAPIAEKMQEARLRWSASVSETRMKEITLDDGCCGLEQALIDPWIVSSS